jgi:hypothetical protein
VWREEEDGPGTAEAEVDGGGRELVAVDDEACPEQRGEGAAFRTAPPGGVTEEPERPGAGTPASMLNAGVDTEGTMKDVREGEEPALVRPLAPPQPPLAAIAAPDTRHSQ